jgi:TRAP-type mannitol/chloroaromatic compound transport system permease small subunit
MLLLFKKIADSIDSITEWTGRVISWLVLFMVLTTFVIVVLRYVFNTGWIAVQESVIYAHALVFMLGAAFALKHGQHVRVDIFYQHMSVRTRAVVDLIGIFFFLIPVGVFILSSSYEYVMDSIEFKEASREAGGLPFVYLLKTQIIVMAVLLLLQALAETLKNIVCIASSTRESH